jgi:hypothetical protein
MKAIKVLLLLLLSACGAERKPMQPVQWSVADTGVQIPAVELSIAQLEAAPVFVPDVAKKVLIGTPPLHDVKTTSAVSAALMLQNGATVVQVDDWRGLVFADSTGTLGPQTRIERYRAHKMTVGLGDTVYMSVGEMLAGNDVVLRFFDGRLLDSVPSGFRQLRGVRADGSLVYWNVAPYRKPKGAPDFPSYVHPEAFVTIVANKDSVAVAEVSIILETRLGRQLPWTRTTRAAVAKGVLWLSATGGPDILRVGADGRPDLRVRWPLTDSVVSAEELEAVKTSMRSGVPVSWDSVRRQTVLDSIAALVPTANARAIDRLLGASDGSVWVRRRVPLYIGNTKDVEWIGFRQNGELIGTLRLAHGTYVHDLSEREALLELPNEPSGVVRVPLVRELVNQKASSSQRAR